MANARLRIFARCVLPDDQGRVVASAARLLERLQRVINESRQNLMRSDEIIVDLAEVLAVDAAALGMLASEFARAGEDGVRLVVENPTVVVEEALRVTRLDTVLLRGKGPNAPMAMRNGLPVSPSTDAAVAAEGNKITVEQYWAEYQKKFENTVRQAMRVGSFTRDDARDLAQSGWLRGSQRLHQLRNTNAVGNWVNTITLRSGRELRARTTREVPWPDRDDSLSTEPAINVEHIDLRRALESSSSRDVQILRLVFIDGVPRSQVAKIMNISKAAVNSAIWRAKEELRRKLAPAKRSKIALAA